MRKSILVIASVAALGLSGCAGMSTTEQRMLSGGAIGAGVGAAGAGLTGGSPLVGGVVGGALGTGAGYLYDRSESGF